MEINFGNFTIGKIKKKNKKKKLFFKSQVFSKKPLRGMKKIQIPKLNDRISIVTLDRYLSEDKHERTINDAGEVKSNGEFAYLDGGYVPIRTPYHIHYS